MNPGLSVAERDSVETGICVRCGHSHAPENRQRIIARMLVDDVTAYDIACAWPCFYGEPASDPPRWKSSRGRRRLCQDLQAIRSTSSTNSPAKPMDASGRGSLCPAPEVKSVIRFRKQCCAVSAETGKRCCLLGGHTGGHRVGREEFIRTAALGETHFPGRAALEEAAGLHPGSEEHNGN